MVFLDIDTQRDFLEPGGSLYLAGSEPILPNLERLSQFARQHRIPILATACAHEPDEPDPEPFPPHCLVGTRGQERIEQTAWTGPDGVVVRPDDRFDFEAIHEPPPHLTLQKRRYDLFSHPDADLLIAFYAETKNNPTFVVYGVATDYCVARAVRGVLDRGHRVALVVDAIRPVEPSAEPALFDEFIRRGATLVLTEAVLHGGAA